MGCGKSKPADVASGNTTTVQRKKNIPSVPTAEVKETNMDHKISNNTVEMNQAEKNDVKVEKEKNNESKNKNEDSKNVQEEEKLENKSKEGGVAAATVEEEKTKEAVIQVEFVPAPVTADEKNDAEKKEEQEESVDVVKEEVLTSKETEKQEEAPSSKETEKSEEAPSSKEDGESKDTTTVVSTSEEGQDQKN
nr:nucleolar protein 58-like [Arachis hypogaea]